MRMRLKKNLEQREERVRPYLIEADDEEYDARKAVLDKRYVDFNYANRNNPCILEVGCGKGGFAVRYAKAHPYINYIAVEKLSNVIIVGAEKAQEDEINNLRFLRSSVEYLPRFLKDHSITKIFMNFPCPFNKESYHDRRMTAESFLCIYDQLLVDGGEIILKTDNARMFAYSIEQMCNHGYLLSEVTLDLYNSPYIDGNIATEYENKFTAEEKPILRLKATKRKL